MFVPDDIKKNIKISAKHYSIANKADRIIREWLEEKGIGEDDTVLDSLIDSLNQGEHGGAPDAFIEFLQSLKIN